jgi:Uma2 family endonuclease
MPTLLTDAPQIPLPPVPPRKRWTREQCAPLEASGLFEQERIELIDGELISKMGKNRPHVKALTWMLIWLQETFGRQFVNTEAPIDVNPADNAWNEPEPDLIVLKRDFSAFESNPQPQDLHLIVEIADSTLKFDLTVKAALYARAEITEYWVLDVAGKRLFVHRNPVSGAYRSVAVYAENEVVAPLAAPDVRFLPAQGFSGL